VKVQNYVYFAVRVISKLNEALGASGPFAKKEQNSYKAFRRCRSLASAAAAAQRLRLIRTPARRWRPRPLPFPHTDYLSAPPDQLIVLWLLQQRFGQRRQLSWGGLSVPLERPAAAASRLLSPRQTTGSGDRKTTSNRRRRAARRCHRGTLEQN